MKQTGIKRLLSAALCALLLLSCASAVFALEPWELQWSLGWTVPDVRVGGSRCSVMQGMAADSRYLYTAKVSSDDACCVLTRTDPDTDAQINLPFYESLDAAEPTPCTALSHANDLAAVETEDGTALFAATVQKGTAVTRLLVRDGCAFLTGWFRLLRADGTTPFAVSSLSFVRREGGRLFFLAKSGLFFYGFVIDETAPGGTAADPTPVVCPRLFEIDTRNAQFYNADGSVFRLPNLETWINQGSELDPAGSVLYVPLWNGGNDNAILLYDVSPRLTAAAMTAADDSADVLFPLNVAFRVREPNLSLFEVETCAFRAAPGGGELLLWFNNNAGSAAAEGIYITNCIPGSFAAAPLVTESTLVYTVKYKANGGRENTALDGRNRMNPTRHIDGAPTNLRANTFLPPAGSIFRGWNLYRSSDKTWLYTLPDGTRDWYRTGKEPEDAVRTLLPDRAQVDHLTAKNGDVFAAHAQWEQPQFTVTFDPAGGVVQFNTMLLHTGDAFGLLPAASMEGMQFDGWYDAEGTPVTAETVFDKAENITLTARWSPLPPEEGQPDEPQNGLGAFRAFLQRIIDWFRSLFSIFNR
ncbi:MAG: InlB B-repeat-containing protein [Clostridia bacterium]|nr:InlB B-repeat-containing protein [Clostridia bacterium]